MTNNALCSVVVLAVVTAAVPARSAELAAADQRLLPRVSSPSRSTEDKCETRMQQLDASPAEGAERLAEKYKVIEYCDRQYKNDKTIQRLANECAKYVEQPVLKQQFFAECQLAAFNYANALYSLKAEYGK